MRKLFGTAALIALAFSPAAHAAPKAESALECGIAADMAIVAHSLAAEHIQRAKANTIMGRIYDVGGSPRGREMMKQILDAAYVSTGAIAQGGSAASGGSAPARDSGQQFAESLFATCMKSGGDMDPVLGRKS